MFAGLMRQVQQRATSHEQAVQLVKYCEDDTPAVLRKYAFTAHAGWAAMGMRSVQQST
jgi:hypothetical protein